MVCACLGPAGNCPCMQHTRGDPIIITETFISQAIFNCLSVADKRTIHELGAFECLSNADKAIVNDLKQQAFFTWFDKRNS